MTSPILHSDVYTDFRGLAELRSHAGDHSEKTLRKVAGEFEALFVQMMLKSMRDANLGEGLMDSDGTRTYQSMYDQQLAIDMSRQQGLGLADMMVKQLQRTDTKAPQAGNDVDKTSSLELDFQGHVTHKKQSPVSPVPQPHNWHSISRQDFVRTLWPHAQQTAHELGTRPEALIAQAALETGWGRRMIQTADGKDSFNLFGIKADPHWQGDRAVTETVEFSHGLIRRERTAFRAYPSVSDSFADYTAFLKANPRYQDALQAGAGASGFISALAAAGYATDPDYAGKIHRIINSKVFVNTVSSMTEPVSGTSEPG